MDIDNVMIDLETLGQRPGCAILSIGAVEFGPSGLGREFYVVVNRRSQLELGLHEDDRALAWWAKQTEAARQVLDDAGKKTKSVPLEKALHQFTTWLSPIGFKRVKVWGNGSDFDNAILNCCYGAVKADVPWDFWNNRCYRTLKGVVDGPKINRQGTYHNALDDAKTQALHAIELHKLLRK